MPPTDKPRPSLIERLRNRSKAWADLCEVASHIGVFPLDCCMIDSRLEAEAADALATPSAERDSKIEEQSASPIVSVVGRVSPAIIAPDEPAMAKPSTVAQPLGAGSGEGRSRDDSRERPATSYAPSVALATNCDLCCKPKSEQPCGATHCPGNRMPREEVIETARELFGFYGWTNERDQQMRKRVEIMRNMALALLDAPASAIRPTWKQQDADMLAAAVDAAIRRGSLDARSEIADCRLDYGQPFSEEEIKAHLAKRRHGKNANHGQPEGRGASG